MKRWIAAVCLSLVMLGGVASCRALTPEEQARVNAILVEMVSLQAELKTLGEAGAELTLLIEQTIAKVRAGEIPIEEGARLVELYRAKKDFVLAAIENVKLKAAKIEAEKKALEDSGIDGWRLGGEVLIAILLGLAGVNRQVKLGKTELVAKGLSTVLEVAKAGEYKDGLTLSALSKVGADPKLAENIRKMQI